MWLEISKVNWEICRVSGSLQGACVSIAHGMFRHSASCIASGVLAWVPFHCLVSSRPSFGNHSGKRFDRDTIVLGHVPFVLLIVPCGVLLFFKCSLPAGCSLFVMKWSKLTCYVGRRKLVDWFSKAGSHSQQKLFVQRAVDKSNSLIL